jgi:hypothetical protein
MPSTTHPPAAQAPRQPPRQGAEATRVRITLETLLLALLAALLGRAMALHPSPAPDLDSDSDWDWNPDWDFVLNPGAGPRLYAAPLRGWHADCESPILYVIGPGPNRGMRALPRAIPTPRPESARAPPPHAPPTPFHPSPEAPRTHAHFIPLS